MTPFEWVYWGLFFVFMGIFAIANLWMLIAYGGLDHPLLRKACAIIYRDECQTSGGTEQ